MLSGAAAIRRRPGMFVGDVHDRSGLHHLLWELVSNCVDEHLAGFAHRVIVTLHNDDSVTVEDDGRGIPVEPGESTLPFVEMALTRIHWTGTFDGHKKHVHLGPHGVGFIVVNALASTFVVEIAREGKLHRQSYREGIPTSPLAIVGDTTTTGTRITYAPDPTIFTATSLDHELVRERLFEVACFNPKLLVRFIDERTDFECPTGILELASRLGRSPDFPLQNAPRLPVAPIYVRGQQDEIGVEVALHWALWSGNGQVRSFVNQRETREGGTTSQAYVARVLRSFGTSALVSAPSLQRVCSVARFASSV